MDSNIFTCIKNSVNHTYRFPWKNFTQLIQDRSSKQGEKIAIIYHDLDQKTRTTLTYADLERKTDYLARCLHYTFGIQPGDKVAMALPNHPGIPLLTLALFRLGAISVPLDLKRDIPDRKRFKLKDSRAKLLCVLPENLKTEEEIVPEIPVVSIDDLLTYNTTKEVSLEPEWSGDPRKEQHTNIILYTSGTTGSPKGTMLTRQSLTSNADGIIRWLDFDQNEHLNLLLPFHHINSTVFSLTMLMTGGTVILNSRYSASNFWPIITKERATAVSIVPTIMQDLLSNAKNFQQDINDITSLKRILIGSAPVPASVACTFYNTFGIRLVQGYGTTEVSLRVTGVPPDLPEEKYRQMLKQNTVGIELKNNNIQIDGDPPEGKLGELLVRGPVVSAGYLNQSEATIEVFQNEWFHTGDIGYYRIFNDQKFYFIHGRKKEILIKGGVNISPIAVENALLNFLPEFSAIYVVGLKNQRWGEIVCAVIVFQDSLKPSKEKTNYIIKMGKTGQIPGLSCYEAPSKVVPIRHDLLPITSTGKVQRSFLRETIQKMVDQGKA